MTEDDWKQHARRVAMEMREFTAPFVSPISHEKAGTEPRLSGTGSFVELFGRRFLLTNEHVVFDEQADDYLSSLAHGLFGTADACRILNGALSAPYPIDCALIPIPEPIWQLPHCARAIPESYFDWAHAPESREILFFRGYAQENSSFHFENLITGSTSYATQEMDAIPAQLDKRFFFALHHSPEKAEIIDGLSRLPLPPGFSGSTVWNTRFVEFLVAGKPWTSDEARVTGVVCRWRSGDAGIVALRVQHLRSWLLNALGEMHARGHL